MSQSDSNEMRRQFDVLDINNSKQVIQDMYNSLSLISSTKVVMKEDTQYIVPKTTTKSNVLRLETCYKTNIKKMLSLIDSIQNKLQKLLNQRDTCEKSLYRYRVTKKVQKENQISINKERDVRKRQREEIEKQQIDRLTKKVRFDELTDSDTDHVELQ